MSRPHFDDESDDDFRRDGKKRKSWKDQRHEKNRKRDTKRDFYETEHDSEEQNYGRKIPTRW